MLVAFTLVLSASALNLRKKHHHHLKVEHLKKVNTTHKANTTLEAFDPHCHQGIMNTEMTICCQADCGECHDGSSICDVERSDYKADNGRESTCCPATITASSRTPSCENSMAPCKIPEYVRVPEVIAIGDRHAQDDCNEVIKKTNDQNHADTAYLKFEGKTVGATTSCGTTYGTVAQAAAACSSQDDCMGFEATPQTDAGPSPGCLFIAGEEIEDLSDSSKTLYLKREDGYAGHTFFFGPTTWGDCTVTCGGGVQAPTYHCMRKEGLSAKLGMCSYLVAMNEDALPEHDHPCNELECPEAESPIGENCHDHLQGCVRNLLGTYYSFAGYYAVEVFGCPAQNYWMVCPSSLTKTMGGWNCGWQRTMAYNYYSNHEYYAETGNVFRSKHGHVNGVETGYLDYTAGFYASYYYSHDDFKVTFACPDASNAANTFKMNIHDNQHANWDRCGNSETCTIGTMTPIVYHECACDKKKKK